MDKLIAHLILYEEAHTEFRGGGIFGSGNPPKRLSSIWDKILLYIKAMKWEEPHKTKCPAFEINKDLNIFRKFKKNSIFRQILNCSSIIKFGREPR